MQDLDVDAVPGRNVALVDLFSHDHARFVLSAFGRAFGRLPDNSSETSKEQKSFLTEAVTGLSDDRKVVSVRLSLFAEMMKDKPWTPATLKEIGGAAGTGVTFLEDAFSSATAFPKHRLHQAAARKVLEALLPEPGTEIKGHLRSGDELMAASGYAGRSGEFDELIRILDCELRLITPTDSESDIHRGSSRDSSLATRFYQLTHDYLVPSIREWLTQKRQETRRGRAELLLAERFALWNRKPENRNLPSAWEWLKIRLWTDQHRQSPRQRHMLRLARRVHGLRWGFGLAVSLVMASQPCNGRIRFDTAISSIACTPLWTPSPAAMELPFPLPFRT